MHDSFGGAAERLAPYVVQRELNEPVTLISGPLSLLGPQSGVLDSNLVFRWAPSTSVEFEGPYSEERVDTSVDVEWHLRLGEADSQVPVFLTEANQGPPTIVRGFASQPFNIGNAPFDVLRFSLANFPQYRGSPVRFERDGASGVAHGRLQVEGDMGVCRLDEVAEARELNERARRGAGFVVSHVGEWIPSSGNMTADEAAATLDMLRLWFGLLRGRGAVRYSHKASLATKSSGVRLRAGTWASAEGYQCGCPRGRRWTWPRCSRASFGAGAMLHGGSR